MHAIKDLDDSWKFILKRRIIEKERGLRMLRAGLVFRAGVLLSTCVKKFVVLPFKALERILICVFIYLFFSVFVMKLSRRTAWGRSERIGTRNGSHWCQLYTTGLRIIILCGLLSLAGMHLSPLSHVWNKKYMTQILHEEIGWRWFGQLNELQACEKSFTASKCSVGIFSQQLPIVSDFYKGLTW